MLSAMISKVFVAIVKHITTFSSLFLAMVDGGMLGAVTCEVLVFYAPIHLPVSAVVPLPNQSVSHSIVMIIAKVTFLSFCQIQILFFLVWQELYLQAWLFRSCPT
jgi:hypothetical protein